MFAHRNSVISTVSGTPRSRNRSNSVGLRIFTAIVTYVWVGLLPLPPSSAHEASLVPQLIENARKAVVIISIPSAAPATAATPKAKTGKKAEKKKRKKEAQKAKPKSSRQTQFENYFRQFMNKPKRPAFGGKYASVGSGFVLDGSGVVVTALHILKGSAKPSVTMHDGRELQAKIVGTDKRTNLAVLRIEVEKPIPSLTLADSSKVRIGHTVIAIGRTFSVGITATLGHITGLKRRTGGGPEGFFQTDAFFGGSMGGGPLLDLDGQVIGINTATMAPNNRWVGIGFSIPANTISTVVGHIRKYGHVKRGWLGVRIQAVTKEIADSLGLDKAHGALVSSITPDSPAASAGLMEGDVILEIDGKPIKDFRDVVIVTGQSEPGKPMALLVFRKGKPKALSAIWGLLPNTDK